MKKKLRIKKKPNGDVKKNDRLSFLEKEFVGKDIQEGTRKKYDFSSKDENGNVMPGKFNKIKKEDFDELVNADPTINKQYTQWLLSVYSKGNLLLEDLYRITDDLNTLFKFKSKVEKEKRDINQFESPEELFNAIQLLVSMPEEELMSNTQIAKKLKLEGAEVFLDSDRWRVLAPLTIEASRLYGSGTRWCTAASTGYNQYDNYTKTRYPNSKLYIIIDKNAPAHEKVNNKFQWHFESKTFMDANDHSIDHLKMLRENKELLDCFLNLKDGNGLKLKFLFGVDLKPEDKIIKNGNLGWLREFQGEELPEGLTITGDVDLTDCRANRVKNLIVFGNLTIKKSEITSIEGKFEVHGVFDAERSKLEHLPEGTYVSDSMMLKESKITKLPKKLKVGGHLFASYLKLEEVPSEIEIGQNLYLHGTGFDISQYPSSVKVGGKIYASTLKPIQ